MPNKPTTEEELLKEFDEKMPAGRLSGFVRMTPEFAHAIISKAYQTGLDDQGRKANSGRQLYQDGFKAGKEEGYQECMTMEKLDVAKNAELLSSFEKQGYQEGARAVIEAIPNELSEVHGRPSVYFKNLKQQLKTKYLNDKE